MLWWAGWWRQDRLAVGAGRLGCWGSLAVHVTWDWIEMGVWVHWEPGAYVMVTLVSLDRDDFIDGVSWMLLECWGQMPELAGVDVTVWGWLCRSL